MSRSLAFAKLSRRSDPYRCAVGLFHAFLIVISVAFTYHGNINIAIAQKQGTANPTATPKTKQGPKPGSAESTEAATATGTIKGRVVSDDGRAVTNATVVAQARGSMTVPRATRVDQEGRFVFEDVSAAAYMISATAPGYIDQMMAQGDFNLWPRYLIGEQVKITLIKGGVITGNVTNSMDEPIVGVPVNAALVSGTPDAMTSFLGLGTVAETDDRGIYRIFGLLPGQYTVTAGGGGPYGQFSASGFDLDVPTYYPSTTRDAAVPVTVQSGQETVDIDIKYRGLEGHSISGFVTGEVESSVIFNVVSVLLSNAGSSSIMSVAVANNVNQNRVFSFNAVGDGEYDLMATFQTGPTDNPLIGTKRVVVRGGDVTGVELKLATMASIAGTIVLDPIKPEAKCDKRSSEIMETVITTPMDVPKRSGSQLLTRLFARTGGTLNAKGEFTVLNLEPSKYRLGVTLPTDAWYVREIIPPGTPIPKSTKPGATTPRPGDAWQGIVTVRSGERAGAFKIAIAQDAAGFAGRVIATPERTIPVGMRVHLVPEERERVDNILRYSESVVSSDGSFSFANLAPGRYFVVTRFEPASETQSTSSRPLAWDPAERIKLRREAEAANKIVELKPCQRVVDYSLAQ